MRNKSNERLEGGRIHVRNISSDEKYPPSMEGGCKRSVANDREKKRERGSRTKERSTNPRREFLLQLCTDFPVNLDEANSPRVMELQAWLTPSQSLATRGARVLPSLRKNGPKTISRRCSQVENWKQLLVKSSFEWKSGRERGRICRENGRKSNGGGRWRREMYGRIPS